MNPDTPLLALSLAFGTGLLASLSPCIYPIIPITLGYLGSQTNTHKKWNVLLYAFGQIFTLVALSAFTVSSGETLGFSSESRWVSLCVGLVLILAGIMSWMERLPSFLSRALDGKFLSKSRFTGLTGAAVLGSGSVLVASPCTTPILAGILAVIASSGTSTGIGVANAASAGPSQAGIASGALSIGASNYLWGLTLMFSYALGFSVLFLLLGLGFVNLKRLPRAGSWLRVINRGSAVLLFLAGFYYTARWFTL